jgi:hypothetical protein
VELNMIPASLKNPFLIQKLDDTGTLPPGNVPELHSRILDKCTTTLADAKQVGRSLGLLVVGEAGSGKSHLIARLRHELATDQTTVLAAIRLGGAHAGRLWRHLREHLVMELLRQYPDRTFGANGLLRILRNRFPNWAASAQDASGGLMDWLLARSKTAANLQPFLDEFGQMCAIDYGLQKVLPRVATKELTNLAHTWLRGQQLGADDLARLGLPGVFPTELEQETHARQVVLSFLRLAGDRTTLFLCFDEVEAIQAGDRDAGALRQFATLATDLLGESGARVVATFIRPNLQIEMSRAVEVSNVEKITQHQTNIPPISWPQAVRVVVSRLEAEPGCREHRLLHRSETYCPLSEQFVVGVYDNHKRSLTPRHLLRACAVEFERLQKPDRFDTATTEKEPELPGRNGNRSALGEEQKITPPPDDDFARVWEKQRRKYVTRPQAIVFDTVMAIGLPWLVKLNGLPLLFHEEKDHRLGDVNLLFHSAGGRKMLGISLCNHQPQPLWHRLDRLLAQWKATKSRVLETLVVLRSSTERTTTAGETRLTSLKQAGARVIRIDPQQLAELAAFQGMMTAALDGDLTREGKPVEAPAYDAWAKTNLSAAVKEFFHVVFEPESTPSVQPAGVDKRPKVGKA